MVPFSPQPNPQSDHQATPKTAYSYVEDRRRYEQAARQLKALAHPDRLQIIDLLGGGNVPVGGLENQLELPQATVSHHLAVLRQAGLFTARRQGTTVRYALADQRLQAVIRAMTQV